MDEGESTGEERVKNFLYLLAQYVRETDAQEKPQLEAGFCRTCKWEQTVQKSHNTTPLLYCGYRYEESHRLQMSIATCSVFGTETDFVLCLCRG